MTDGTAPAMLLVEPDETVDEGPPGEHLHLRIESGADRQPTLVELLLAVPIAALAPHFLGKITGRIAVR